MFVATAMTFERSALIKIISDLESALAAVRSREDHFAKLASMRLQEALDLRKKDLIMLERNRSRSRT